MRFFKNIFLVLIILGFFITSILGFLVYQAHKHNGEFGTKIVIIEQGTSLSGIANLFKKEELILNRGLFIVYAFLNGKASKMQAGVYEIDTPVSIADLITVVSGGDINGFALVTIPEGFTSEQIAQKLEAEEVLESKIEFLNQASLSTASAYDIYKYEFLNKISASSLEGFLFPDTYEFRKGESAVEVLDKFLKNFDKKAWVFLRSAAGEATDGQAKKFTSYEYLIIASLLEREVQTEQDMKLVAGVLANRLNLDMLLQVDATLAYITNKQTGQITNQDKLINSLFNTYKYSGLPPAPIANSGLRAINAALNPQANNYLYYLSDKNNITHFAETLEEHIRNKATYLK
ncbi:MAG: hypothetical protein A3F94_01805 [Candidatus Spechtbacteria bacterium RIFCSPLOWO2_12_FULL_38_22]|uniref:Endolytic murein transglycosylase n=1 Tax=Candidatus Spechtbacteria bacterium RIFCSPLOWO2_12_FULL_38_22 TaxID=1802165 RepID=A0A1G2HGN9_9BACT|nr:MAG: hypothetical protein A2728_00410 [Candidatus Spechtbacteria bacterium RIFCSPHIGHO2_01_FULL_38_11]OGZ59664.1 MAG: hypothetical protein A3E58_00390 [Candidatus Spechtbacteria bacterium RIFCSPHIGHO2_12_FULL_38_30]OGZ61664.1 MAG: hypothetical protein A3F94_01805 [Candidatus Spechtbacteria bacterium RIFCSPLOWO2_12_FULL_38_22]